MPLIQPQYADRRHLLLPVYPVKLGIGYKQDIWDLPLGTTHHQIIYIESGECCITLNNQKHHFSKGTAIYVAKVLPIRLESEKGDLHISFVSFEGAFADSLKQFYAKGDFYYCINNKIGELICDSFNAVKSRLEVDVISKHIFDLLIAFFRSSNEMCVPQALSEARDYIIKNHHRDISVSDIASAVGISSSFLTRLFRSYENKSPLEYLRATRLDHARQLLSQNSNLSINAIAQKCGFLDSAYFCKVFKAEFGKTPKTYSLEKINAESNSDELLENDDAVIINENFSIEPTIVSKKSDVVGSAWVKNDGIASDNTYHANNITWENGYIRLSGRSSSTRYFYYVSDLVLKPGKYNLTVDLKVANPNDVTTVRISVYGYNCILFNPGITHIITLYDNWFTHSIEFTVEKATSFHVCFFGGPDNKYIHDFCIKNLIIEKM